MASNEKYSSVSPMSRSGAGRLAPQATLLGLRSGAHVARGPQGPHDLHRPWDPPPPPPWQGFRLREGLADSLQTRA